MSDDAMREGEAAELPLFPFGLCCYLVPMTEPGEVDTEAVVRSVIAESSLEEVWLSVAEVTLRDHPFLALSLQALRDTSTEGGSPVMHGGVAEILSEVRGYLPVLLVAAGGEEAALGLYQQGEQAQTLSDHRLPRTADPVLDRLSPQECLEIDGLADLGMPQCGEGAVAVHLKRELSVPAWVPRTVDIFRFSERNNLGVDPEEDSDGGRLCFLALDMTPLRKDVRRSVKVGIHLLESYARPESKRFLGPMSVDLPPLLDELRAMEGNLALSRCRHFADLTELLALISTRLSTPGNRLEYWDQVFFPLLNLSDNEEPRAFDDDDLDDMEPMDLLTAMADQLPYFAPEGELLESVADEELSPLLAELEVDRSGSGSVFFLDTARIASRLGALTMETFGERCDRFSERWFQSLGIDTDEDRQAWVEKRLSLDRTALSTFFATWAELRALVEVAQANDLRVAALFYE